MHLALRSRRSHGHALGQVLPVREDVLVHELAVCESLPTFPFTSNFEQQRSRG